MNTISPPPQFKRISVARRAFGVVLGLAGAASANALLGYSVFSFYTRQTQFVPYDTTSTDLLKPVAKAHNPNNNPPGCIDHAIKTIPLATLRARYGLRDDEDVPVQRLTTDFCRGIWSGIGFRVQRKFLERKYRALPGREDHLWDVKQLEQSEYPVGTKITDHFEVVEHTPERVSATFLFSCCTLDICSEADFILGRRALWRLASQCRTQALGWPLLHGGLDR
jgi:hypothetical protein